MRARREGFFGLSSFEFGYYGLVMVALTNRLLFDDHSVL